MSIRFHVLTLFPAMFVGPFAESIIARAKSKGLVDIQVHNVRDQAHDRHRTTDDYPFGGGAGMVMKPEPLFEGVEAIRASQELDASVPIVLLSPQGRTLTHSVAQELAGHRDLVLICGRYDGVDERVRRHLATDEVSIGDYVLSGGELAAMVVIEAVSRLVPGVVGASESVLADSFASGLLQYPQFTRPADFRGWAVPEVLLSGDHAQIALWRRRQSLERTALARPDLLLTASLSDEDRRYIEIIKSAGEPGDSTRA